MSSSQLSIQPKAWIGQTVGERHRYRLEKRLGGGGMGEVFLAIDTVLGQQVALKLLRDTLTTGDLRKRFESEFAVCAALSSPHIVQIIDYGITNEGQPFYVMEYLRGRTLGQRLHDERQLTVEQTASILTQLCAGLKLAHDGVELRSEAGTINRQVSIVHRDLKPDNIFLVPSALGELVKIIDFGVAKIRCLQADPTNATCMFIGTFLYAAPEQFEAAGDLDKRADIYSLGMIVYQMLSGTDPFGFGNARQVNEAAWALAHLSKPPIPLRQQPGCEALSPDLEAVVMRCLEKQPDRRFSSVTELNQAVLQAAGLEMGELGRVQALTSLPDPQPAQVLTPNSQAFSRSTTQTSAVTLETAISKPARPQIASRPFTWRLVGSAIALALALPAGAYLWQHLTKGLPNTATPAALDKPKFSTTTTLVNQAAPVWSIALSPNGQTLLAASEDNTIKLQDITGVVQKTLKGHTDIVRTIALNADGKTLVSGSGDNTIKLWNLQTGELLRTLAGSSPVWSIALSPDSNTLVSGYQDNTIKLWDLKSGEVKRLIAGHTSPVYAVAFSPDGQTFATGSEDNTIKLWNTQTGELTRTLAGHREAVRSIAISADGTRIASASWDNTVRIWDAQTGNLLHTLTGHRDRVVALAINGNTVASGSIDRTIKVWNLQTGKLIRTLEGHQDWILALAFNPSNDALISSSKDKTIKIWQ